ncbi:MAG: pitrilysin family protein [Candidatus Moraniibacteriota bacterium]
MKRAKRTAWPISSSTCSSRARTSGPPHSTFLKELDGLGAEYNAFTGEEYTGYYAKVAAKHWPDALDIVSDLFLNAKIEPQEIDRERGAVLQEINMYEDMPMRRVQEYYKTLLYGDTPLGWDIAGPKTNIKAFQRRDFIKFLNRAYTAENIVVGVAGNIDPKAVRKAVDKIFAATRPGKKPKFLKVRESQAKPAIFLQKKKVDQTNLVVGVRAYDLFHKDRPVLAVSLDYLGRRHVFAPFYRSARAAGLGIPCPDRHRHVFGCRNACHSLRDRA